MKRLSLLLLLVSAALPSLAQTDLYQRYAQREDVKVASVSNFTIDSSSHVDVTIIKAESNEGWDWMRSEFSIGQLAPEQQATILNGSDVVLFTRRSRANPAADAPVVNEQVDLQSSCYMGISYLSRTVYFFCAETEEESDAIVKLLIKKIMHTSH